MRCASGAPRRHTQLAGTAGLPRRRTAPAALLGAVVCCLVCLVFAGPPRARAADAADVLREAERLLGQKQIAAAVDKLRRVARDPAAGADAAARARRLLAENGRGVGFHLVLEDRQALLRFGYDETDLAQRLDALHERLRGFLAQVYGAAAAGPPEVRVQILDSRGRFRGLFPGLQRRSALVAPDAGRKSEPWRVCVFHDSRIVHRQDQMDLLLRDAMREIAAVELRFRTRAPLPETVAAGLGDYLVGRLLPRKLVSIHQTPEELLKGFAREALGRVQDRDEFRVHVLSRAPDEKVAANIAWQWLGLSSALIDCLLHAPREGEADSVWTRLLRVERLQGLLREYDAAAAAAPWPKEPEPRRRAQLALFERLLERHFGLDFAELHAGYLLHVQKFSPLAPDFEGLTD